MALDTFGNFLWERRFDSDTTSGGASYFRGFHVDEENYIWIVGAGTHPSRNTAFDIWVVRVDSMGCLEPGCHLTGIEDFESEPHIPFVVAPNPSDGRFTLMLERPATDGMRIEVIDLSGRVVFSKVPPTGNFDVEIEMDGFSSAVYLVRVVDSFRQIGVREIIIR
jgi:hypothetical protein